MNIPWLKKEPTALDLAIERATLELNNHAPHSEEFARITKRITEMNKVKTGKKSRRLRVSPDVIVTVLGNVLITTLVVNYEKDNSVTSKVFQFLHKAGR